MIFIQKGWGNQKLVRLFLNRSLSKHFKFTKLWQFHFISFQRGYLSLFVQSLAFDSFTNFEFRISNLQFLFKYICYYQKMFWTKKISFSTAHTEKKFVDKIGDDKLVKTSDEFFT